MKRNQIFTSKKAEFSLSLRFGYDSLSETLRGSRTPQNRQKPYASCANCHDCGDKAESRAGLARCTHDLEIGSLLPVCSAANCVGDRHELIGASTALLCKEPRNPLFVCHYETVIPTYCLTLLSPI